MKKIALFLLALSTFISSGLFAHEMQHGFIISDDEKHFEHLVANGHHSHQLSFSGELYISDSIEKARYTELKMRNRDEKKSYFLFQAQKLDLPSTHVGQILDGHIIESNIGDYSPGNIIVRDAKIRVHEVNINVVNPFFVK